MTSLVQAIADAGVALRGATSATEVAEALLRDARRVLRCQAGAVHLVSPDRVTLIVAHNDVVQPSIMAARRGDREPLEGPGVASYVARNNAPLVVPDVATLTEARWDAAFEQRHGFRTRALLALPLVARHGGGDRVDDRVNDRVIGVLELQNPTGPTGGDHGAFGPEQVAVAHALATQGGLALAGALDAERAAAEQADAWFTLACMPEYRDPDIRWHVRRISGYSRVLARATGLAADEVRTIELASVLHDVGKVGIPPEILFKPGKLTDEEFAITREHCALGHQLLSTGAGSLLQTAADVALSHHERWDGTGYPHGRAGAAIPMAARIVAIADVFDALTTRRSYKPAIGLEQSLRILGQESGKHFDPDLVDAFQRVFSEVLDVKRRFTPDE